MAVVLSPEQWSAREADHQRRVDAWTAGRRARAAVGAKHPVDDFLFTYYALRPAQLRRWHPGAGTVLAGADARTRLTWRWYREHPDGVAVDVEAFATDRGDTIALLQRLLAATAARPAQLGCFGLHEWAMVYRLAPGTQRHEDWPLRLGPAATDAVVASQPLRCTHFDAFRFFTPPAGSLNVVQPSRQTQVDLEQPGCLHATMDLLKWALKLGPVVPGELTGDCFELARDVRVLDMRASPYDLSALGYAPVTVETPEGRAEYVAAQRAFTSRGQALRRELGSVLESLPAGRGSLV